MSNRCQGFPLFDATIWVEDLGNRLYRVWYSHNDAPHKHYNEGVTSKPVPAVQENRELVLKIYARHAQGTTPALVRAARVEKYSAWAQLFTVVVPCVTLLWCCASLGLGTTVLLVLVVLCVRNLA